MIDELVEMEVTFEVEFHLRIEAVNKETGARRVVGDYENTIQDAGKDDWLSIITGQHTNYYNQSNTKLRIYTTGGSPEYTLDCHASYPQNPSTMVLTWQFEDLTTNAYTINTVRLYNNASSVEFTQVGPGAFTGGGDATKSAAENYVYTYQLTITTSGNINSDGAAVAVDRFIGNAATVWDSTSSRLWISNNGGTVTSTTGAPSSGPTTPADSSGYRATTVTFTSAQGANSQEWYIVAWDGTGGGASADQITKKTADLGTKAANVSRAYSITLRF